MGTLTFSIARTSLSLSPLVLSANDDSNTWGILPGYTPPGRIARVRYASSNFTHGDVAVGSTWQQAVHSFDVSPTVASAAGLAAAVAELQAALGQFTYLTTVTRNGVAEVWTCDTGSLSPAPLDVNEVDHHQPVYSVTIPCYPVAS